MFWPFKVELPEQPEYGYKVVYQRQPHKCPVCAGRGQTHAAFYADPLSTSGSTIGGMTECRTCSGYGIVWEPKY